MCLELRAQKGNKLVAFLCGSCIHPTEMNWNTIWCSSIIDLLSKTPKEERRVCVRFVSLMRSVLFYYCCFLPSVCVHVELQVSSSVSLFALFFIPIQHDMNYVVNHKSQKSLLLYVCHVLFSVILKVWIRNRADSFSSCNNILFCWFWAPKPTDNLTAISVL